MIKIYLSKEEYEYDIQPLVKAFYPDCNIAFVKEYEYEMGVEEDILYLYLSLNATNILMKAIRNGKILDEIKQDNVLLSGKAYKNYTKRMFYGLLEKITSITLPWGVLTGVRPTKLALEPLEANVNVEEIKKHLKEEYLCSDEKTDLSIEIAQRELELLKSIDYKNSYSIYIGIPFCPTTCLYCSFTSYSAEKFKNMIDEYLEALMKEITYAKSVFPNKKLSTIYIGGGTPTTLSAEQLDRLLTHVHNNLDVKNAMEFTVEAGRPDSITLNKLKVLKNHGVTRISINPQTMVQRTLDVIGRKHTIEQVFDSYAMAREVGFDNINMDIIIGLPGETKEDVFYTLNEISKLNPDSLTVHTLAIKRAARLNTEKSKYQELTPVDTKQMLMLTMEYAKENNYLPYYLYRQKNMADNLENTGYARSGKEGIYNILIMEEKQTILALGAGSMSKFVFQSENRIERVDNVKSLNDYISRVDEMIQRKITFLESNRNELERIY